VLINSSALWSEGEFVHTRCFTRDITGRKHAENALRTSELRYRRLFETSRNAIVILDGDTGHIIDSNPFLTELTGYDRSELIGKQLWQLGIFENAESDQAALKHVRAQGMIHYAQLSIHTKAGTRAEAECVAVGYEMNNKEFIQFSIHDITARVRAEEGLRAATDQLRERVDELRDADRRKNEFLAMLAHELRNPLAPVQNAVHLLRKNGPTDPESRWAHDVIERQVQHMTRMVDDLLDVSRITRGMINLHKEAIDIATVVTRAVEMTQPIIDARKHHLIVAPPAAPVRLEADPPRLAQVLANLLNNAAKYTEEGGSIWLTVEPQGSEVVVKVRDNGIGIPPEYLPRVFDLFSQEDSSLERTHGGLGIGLTLVRVLVKMHGGVIQAFSPGTGQGSEFVMRLPALPDTQTPQASAPAEEALAVAPPRRILVVDDNVDGAKSLTMLLRMYGHEVHTAHDGPAALEVARNTPLDVVLLDIGMPHMSGLEVARRLRGDLRLTNVLLIAMTGYGQDDDRHRSQAAGFNAHMIKPLDLDALQAILARSGAAPTVPG
jgi:PAS domain S-box-containing protein